MSFPPLMYSRSHGLTSLFVDGVFSPVSYFVKKRVEDIITHTIVSVLNFMPEPF